MVGAPKAIGGRPIDDSSPVAVKRLHAAAKPAADGSIRTNPMRSRRPSWLSVADNVSAVEPVGSPLTVTSTEWPTLSGGGRQIVAISSGRKPNFKKATG